MSLASCPKCWEDRCECGYNLSVATKQAATDLDLMWRRMYAKLRKMIPPEHLRPDFVLEEVNNHAHLNRFREKLGIEKPSLIQMRYQDE